MHFGHCFQISYVFAVAISVPYVHACHKVTWKLEFSQILPAPAILLHSLLLMYMTISRYFISNYTILLVDLELFCLGLSSSSHFVSNAILLCQ